MLRAILTRRRFLALAGASAVSAKLHAQTVTAHADVAALEHDHILSSAEAALHREPGQNLSVFSKDTSAFVAALLLTREPQWSQRAAEALKLWPQRFPFPPSLASRDDIVDLVPHAELARASSFVLHPDALPTTGADVLTAHMTSGLDLLNNDVQARLARDTKDHRASAWLLVAAALARATRNEKQLDQCRMLFKKPTVRNQIVADGRFPQEIASENPFRNSLFNFDLLAGACQLLTSPFDDLWNYELPDGPGLRTAAAFLYPLIREPQHWPFIADAQYFRELPRRRPGLLLAGRAYDRPEYVDLYRNLPDTPPPAALAYTLPISQPLLWTARAPHGF